LLYCKQKIFITSSHDTIIKFWSLSLYSLIEKHLKHTKEINTMAIGSSGKWLLSGSRDKTIRVWSIKKKKLKPRKIFTRHNSEVNCIVILPDSKRAVSGDTGGNIVLWEIPAGIIIKKWETKSQWLPRLSSLAVSPDGKMLAAGENPFISLWSLEKGKEGTFLEELGEKSKRQGSILFSQDGKWMASGAEWNELKIWSLPDGKLHKSIKTHFSGVRALVLSPDNKSILVGSFGARTKEYSFPQGKYIKSSEMILI